MTDRRYRITVTGNIAPRLRPLSGQRVVLRWAGPGGSDVEMSANVLSTIERPDPPPGARWLDDKPPVPAFDPRIFAILGDTIRNRIAFRDQELALGHPDPFPPA